MSAHDYAPSDSPQERQNIPASSMLAGIFLFFCVKNGAQQPVGVNSKNESVPDTSENAATDTPAKSVTHSGDSVKGDKTSADLGRNTKSAETSPQSPDGDSSPQRRELASRSDAARQKGVSYAELAMDDLRRAKPSERAPMRRLETGWRTRHVFYRSGTGYG